jgi:hypothetical protein
MLSKACKKCGVVKSLDEFYQASGTKDGHRGECISCAKVVRRSWYEANREKSIANVKQWQQDNASRLSEYRRQYNARPERKRAMREAYYQRTYGISADEFDALLEKQGGVCAICAGADPKHLDHDHATGAIRGILCVNCNHGLGKFFDDVELLERAVAYLRGR